MPPPRLSAAAVHRVLVASSLLCCLVRVEAGGGIGMWIGVTVWQEIGRCGLFVGLACIGEVLRSIGVILFYFIFKTKTVPYSFDTYWCSIGTVSVSDIVSDTGTLI